MPNDEHNPTDTIRASGCEDPASGVQLSENTTRRLEKLARWRIDTSLLKFPKDAPTFKGGYAVVSRALLRSSSDQTRGKAMGSNVGTLTSNNRTSNADSNSQRREAEGSDHEGKPKDILTAEGQEQESDGETSGSRKAVAVKKMKLSEQGGVVRVLGLALREAEFLVKLDHENIIKLEGFVEDVSKEVIWLVFPWEENGTLKDFVALHNWEVPERISLIFDVTGGVEYLHSRTPPICHGDLKSINILVNSKCRAVITDFGSAHHPVAKDLNKKRERPIEEPQSAPSLEATHCASTNTITLTCKHYTVRWAAPELLAEDESSLASDIWALGWVAYEVMTNYIPFHDVKAPKVINLIVRGDLPSVSNDARMMLMQALCSLVGQCWIVDPSKRPAAKDCRESIKWMPMIAPNPMRTKDAAGFMDRSGELLMKLGNMYRRQSDYPNASKYYAEALDVYTNLAGSRGKADALKELAQIQSLQQEYSEAVKSYNEALKVYTDIGDRQGRASALFRLAEVHRVQNEYSQAVAFYTECLQIRTEIGDRHGRAYALKGLADVHRVRNEYSPAVAFYTECLQIRTEIGDRHGRASTLFGLAEVHRVQNEYSPAVAFYTECLQIRTEIGDRHGRASALEGLATVHRLRNEYSQAVAFYTECLQIRTEIGDRHGRASALWGLAEVHQVRNEYSQAVAFYTECLQIRTEIGDRDGRASTLFGLAEVHRLQNEYTQAVAFYSESLQIRTEIADRRGRAQALWGLAEVHRLQEDYSQAMTFFSDALTTFTDIGDRLWRAYALRDIADTHRDQDDLSSAIHHYEQAAEIFKQIGHTREEAYPSQQAAKLRRLMEQKVAT